MPKKVANIQNVRDAVAKFDSSTGVSKKATARAILNAHDPGDVLAGDEEHFARRLLSCHPSAERKIGVGIKSLRVGFNSGWRCFDILRIDDTSESFSMHTSIQTPKQERTSRVAQAFRAAIKDQTDSFRASQIDSSTNAAVCKMCETKTTQLHVDHDAPMDFVILTDRFRALFLKEKLPEVVKPVGKIGAAADWRIKDVSIMQKWCDFHRRNAKLQILCVECNLTKTKAIRTQLVCTLPA